ncbi:MAG: hypothetical protein WB608_20385 [Terracidiphilus sp.]
MACIELLSKEAQKRARKGEAHSGRVIRHRFQELHQEGQKLIQGWAERAAAQSNCVERDSFELFIYGWIALNGWACCVTAEDRDSDYLDALLLDADLNREFQGLLVTDLLAAVGEFQSTWPIFSSKDIGYNVDWGGTREQAIERYRTLNPAPGRKPACTFLHRERGEPVPGDWPHTLSAIYQVRCNLFHGYKGVYSENDVSIVSKAFRVLVRLLPMLIPNVSLPSAVNGARSTE